eukprot:g4044.t1
MAPPTLVIMGTARNVEEYSASVIATIKRESASFKLTKVIVFENDSDDNTLTELRTWETKLGVDVDVISEDLKSEDERTVRLAHGRNQLWKRLWTSPNPPDYVLMLDLDNVNENLTGVETCFDLPRGWGACCTNQRGKYYDVWALRTFDDWCPCDVWYECESYKFLRQIKIPHDADPIQVRSCFGGAALYNYSEVSKNAVYSGFEHGHPHTFSISTTIFSVGGVNLSTNEYSNLIRDVASKTKNNISHYLLKESSFSRPFPPDLDINDKFSSIVRNTDSSLPSLDILWNEWETKQDVLYRCKNNCKCIGQLQSQSQPQVSQKMSNYNYISTTEAKYQLLNRQLMSFFSSADYDGNSLLCADENEIKVEANRISTLARRFNRVNRGCLRLGQLDLAIRELWQGRYIFSTLEKSKNKMKKINLDKQRNDLVKFAKEIAHKYGCGEKLQVNDRKSYKFEGIPDYKRLSHWPLVSQEGIESTATFFYHGNFEERGMRLHWWRPTDVVRGDIIVLRSAKIEDHRYYWSNIHPAIKVPYILISFAEGINVTPGIFVSHLNDKNLLAWFTLNRERKMKNIKNIIPLPIGMVWRFQTLPAMTIAENASSPLSSKRDILLFLSFKHDGAAGKRNQNERKNLYAKFENFPNVYHPLKRTSMAENFELLTRSKFVLSPFGAGPDCHRTWEAIAAGAVPIIKSHGGLEPLFHDLEKLGRVIVIHEWEEVTPSFLDRHITKYGKTIGGKYELPKILLLDTWIDLMNEKNE